jgi:hypothetical protein
VTIEEQCAAKAVKQKSKKRLDRLVIWAVRSNQALFELTWSDCAAP